MFGSEELRDAPGVRRLVITRIIEPDRKTVQPVTGLLRRERGDGARIETAGEK